MTKLLDKAIETVRHLPPERQDAIAREILLLADGNNEEEEDIDPADLDAVLQSLADADAGRFATDEEIEAAFRRFGK